MTLSTSLQETLLMLMLYPGSHLNSSVESPIFHVAGQQVTLHPAKAQRIARDTARDKTL